MGNIGKEGQSSQRQMNDYERSRMLRIQENQGKLQQFGVKNIAKSLTSLVESQISKKRKGKPVVTDERDVEYVPDFGSDNEDNYEEEISKSVKVPKKVHVRVYTKTQRKPRLKPDQHRDHYNDKQSTRKLVIPWVNDDDLKLA